MLAVKYRPQTFNDVVGQELVVKTLTNELHNNTTKQAYIFEGQTGGGKAQPLYSKVLTNSGYVNMGDIKVGDSVFGDDGKLHEVLGVFPQGYKDVYEITLSDGTTCRCSDEHLWTVSANHGKTWETITLNDIINHGLCLSPKDGTGKDGHRWIFKLPITKPVEFNNNEGLKIDPWLFGLLIGDGGVTDYTIQLTNYEEDIINRVKNILIKNGFELNYMTKYHTDKKSFRITDTRYDKNTTNLSRNKGIFGNRFLQYIYDYGLLGKKSSEKHIPKEYLFSSVENRLKLLQGIFDADGTVGKNSSLTLSTSSKQLANDIVFLIQSLGGTVSCNEHEAYYTYNGKKLRGLNNFELYISMPADMLPFTSEKHTSRYHRKRINVYRTIRDIKYIGKELCQCIYIDNPSHLYLTDNMIVTHNTTISTIMAKALNGITIDYDVALHNSVDDIRALLETIKQKPIGKDKIIVILDEVQNIFNRKDSLAAQSLLKVLEQPPKHVVFIMCTTEGDKIIDTIKNRCEVLTFNKIDENSIKDRLKYICDKESIKYDNEDCLLEIAKRSDGSMRNAITKMEQISSLGTITMSLVTKTLSSKYDDMFNVLYAVFDNNTESLVTTVNNINDIDKFVESFFSFILDICVYIRTSKYELTELPLVFKDNVQLNEQEQQVAFTIMNVILELQYNGKNSPILKQLLIASLMEINNHEDTLHNK